jgi:hypothetical protein
MALKHEFNRQDRSDETNPVLRIDAYLTQVADRAAERWRHRSGGSRQGLTLALYVAATLLGLGYVLITHEFLFLGIALLAYMGSLPGRQRGSLVEEMQLEVSGLPRHTLQYLAVGVLALGLFGVASSLPFVLLGGGLNDIAGALGGMALIVLKSADYIARTNPSDRDGDRERQIERIQHRVTVGAAA